MLSQGPEGYVNLEEVFGGKHEFRQHLSQMITIGSNGRYPPVDEIFILGTAACLNCKIVVFKGHPQMPQKEMTASFGNMSTGQPQTVLRIANHSDHYDSVVPTSRFLFSIDQSQF